MRVLGLDPGLQKTGWGIIEAKGNRLSHVANGIVRSDPSDELSLRLLQLHNQLVEIIEEYRPDAAAVEETFVNKNPNSTLKLGQARGVVLLAPARFELHVGEYSATNVKKSVVGTGRATKDQISMMVSTMLPGVKIAGEDAADALAVAICHSHHMNTNHRVMLAGK